MKSFKQWLGKKWKEWNTPIEASPEDKKKSLAKQYERIANWGIREVIHAADSGLEVDYEMIERIAKRNTKEWFGSKYNDLHTDKVITAMQKKLDQYAVTESSQSGGPKSPKRSKADEMALAKQSPIYKDTQYQGWKIVSSVHAAAQAFSRRPEFEFSQWKELHRRTVKALNNKKNVNGDYIVYSKSMEQGYVLSVRGKKIRIVTVLPKGRKNPKPGTEVLMVENFAVDISDFEFVEID